MKTFFSILGGLLGAALSIYGIYQFVSYATGLVPAGEWQGLIQLFLIIFLICLCAGVIWLAIVLCTIAFGSVGLAIGYAIDKMANWHKTRRYIKWCEKELVQGRLFKFHGEDHQIIRITPNIFRGKTIGYKIYYGDFGDMAGYNAYMNSEKFKEKLDNKIIQWVD